MTVLFAADGFAISIALVTNIRNQLEPFKKYSVFNVVSQFAKQISWVVEFNGLQVVLHHYQQNMNNIGCWIYQAVN